MRQDHFPFFLFQFFFFFPSEHGDVNREISSQLISRCTFERKKKNKFEKNFFLPHVIRPRPSMPSLLQRPKRSHCSPRSPSRSCPSPCGTRCGPTFALPRGTRPCARASPPRHDHRRPERRAPPRISNGTGGRSSAKQARDSREDAPGRGAEQKNDMTERVKKRRAKMSILEENVRNFFLVARRGGWTCRSQHTTWSWFFLEVKIPPCWEKDGMTRPFVASDQLHGCCSASKPPPAAEPCHARWKKIIMN